jgi:hypothetical protein
MTTTGRRADEPNGWTIHVPSHERGLHRGSALFPCIFPFSLHLLLFFSRSFTHSNSYDGRLVDIFCLGRVTTHEGEHWFRWNHQYCC